MTKSGCTAALAVAILAGDPACLRQTEFHCANNADCGGGGRCESVGYCSIADSSCGGYRFGESAGPYANQCVGGGGGVDGGVDSKPPVDTLPVGCPASYAPLTGGSVHRYRVIAGAAGWTDQRDACAADSQSAYLAIPDDTAELQALSMLSGVTLYWVGISDLATENTFLTVKNTPATPVPLPWTTGAPDNGPPPENCVEVISATSLYNDERCNTNLSAICECDP